MVKILHGAWKYCPMDAGKACGLFASGFSRVNGYNSYVDKLELV